MKYEAPDNLSHDAAEALATGGDATALSKALVSLSLSDPDLRWTAELLLGLTHHENPNVRGNALLGLGHLARRFRALPDRDAAAAAVKAGLADANAFVRGQADSAADDLESFLAK